MKIIDEKGRLFGKLNLIDLRVIVLILAVVLVAVWKLGVKLVEAYILSATAVQTDAEHFTLYVTVQADATYAGYVYKVGSQEVRVGYEYIVKTSEFEMTGIISGMEVSQ